MIGVIGAGAFGTALALTLGRGGSGVRLWARNPDQAARMQALRQTVGKLPALPLPETVSVTSDLDSLYDASVLLVALPMQQMAGFLAQRAPALGRGHLVACTKGLDLNTLNGPTALLSAACPRNVVAVLTGPGFAADLAAGMPTALVLACANPGIGIGLQRALSTPVMRLYRTDDIIGAELGGALKNVIAIAAGIVIGAGLGESARAALITRGQAEMVRLAMALGARAETLVGLSGLGDLVLTCTSQQSRNFRYGFALATGSVPVEATVEGAATAHAVARLAVNRAIEMPISAMVSGLLNGNISIEQATGALLSRPLKQE